MKLRMPRFTALALVLACMILLDCSSMTSTFPKPVIPSRPAPTDWPDSGAVVVEEHATIEFTTRRPPREREDRAVAVVDHWVRLKILTEAGLAAARIEIPLDGFTYVEQLDARSVSPKGNIVNISKSDTKEAPRTLDGVNAARIRTLTFTIPEARVGGLVEYRYRLIYADAHMLPPWTFGRPYPVLRSELALVGDEGFKFDFRYGIGENVKEVQPLRRNDDNDRERLLFVERDLPPYFKEPDMPHPARVMPWVAATLISAPASLGYEKIETWSDVSNFMHQRFDQVGEPPTMEGPPTERFTRVRDTLKTIPLLGLGVMWPTPALELWQGEATSSRDAAALLWYGLANSGAQAHLALVAGDAAPPLLDGFPALYPFAKAVVAINVQRLVDANPTCRGAPLERDVLCNVAPGGYIFLDPTCRDCRYGELPTDLTGGRALILPRGQQPEWVDIPIDPPERNRQIFSFDFTLGVEGKLAGNVKISVEGARARQLRKSLRESGLKASHPDAKELIREQVFSGNELMHAEVQEITNAFNASRPLGITAKLSSAVQRLSYEQFRLRPLDVMVPALDSRLRQARRYNAVMDLPAWIEVRGVIRLPVGYEAEDKMPVTIANDFAEYAVGFAKRDRNLHFSRRIVFKKHVIAAAEWDDFRAFLDEVLDAESTAIAVGLRDN